MIAVFEEGANLIRGLTELLFLIPKLLSRRGLEQPAESMELRKALVFIAQPQGRANAAGV